MNNRVYIAGPVTGVEGYEKNFREAEEKLRLAGYEPVNPVAPGLVPGAEYRYYIDRGILMLMECDYIYLMKGWQYSEGAKLEARYGKICGLKRIVFRKKED